LLLLLLLLAIMRHIRTSMTFTVLLLRLLLLQV
jgi:hypothetical protein